MKQTTFTLLLTVLLSMVGLHAYASDIEVDGIYYNFNANTKTAEVIILTIMNIQVLLLFPPKLRMAVKNTV